MQTGVFHKAGITRMAVAAFPEGNPDISENALHEAVTAKANFARSNGYSFRLDRRHP
jgi:hypothetical protein